MSPIIEFIPIILVSLALFGLVIWIIHLFFEEHRFGKLCHGEEKTKTPAEVELEEKRRREDEEMWDCIYETRTRLVLSALDSDIRHPWDNPKYSSRMDSDFLLRIQLCRHMRDLVSAVKERNSHGDNAGDRRSNSSDCGPDGNAAGNLNSTKL